MRIGIASLGRVSEDTGGKNYMVHFLSELGRINSGHEIVLFLSEAERELIQPPPDPRLEKAGEPVNPRLFKAGAGGGFFKVIEIPNSKRTPLHKVIGEQWKLPKAIRDAKID